MTTEKPAEKPDRPRLSIELQDGQKEKLNVLLPWGTQRLVLCKIIDLAINFIQTNGLGISMDALLNDNATIVINKIEPIFVKNVNLEDEDVKPGQVVMVRK